MTLTRTWMRQITIFCVSMTWNQITNTMFYSKVQKCLFIVTRKEKRERCLSR
jgi:hypothetical protein